MANKAISLFSFCSLLLVLPLLFEAALGGHSKDKKPSPFQLPSPFEFKAVSKDKNPSPFEFKLAASKDKKPSPFEFIQHLQGCRKGDKVRDVRKLKKYLEKFGYLSYSKNKANAHTDDFDEALESAIKTYQLNFHLNSTGTLDAETVSKMMMPRCAVVDIINGTSRMRSGGHLPGGGSKSIHEVSNFTFFRGNPKWSASELTYAFLPQTPNDAQWSVWYAFRTWAENTHFTFSLMSDYKNADMTIGFASGDHGDGYPFDGPLGALAHSFSPRDGRFHYDADETWSYYVDSNAFHMYTVALHEIGHLLGLGHSSDENAIMYPTISPGVSRALNQDDIQGIRELYNT